MTDFMRNNHFYPGANYWASHASINMWSDWRADVVEEDFRKLSGSGIKLLRIFLLWPDFQPLKAIYANSQIYEYRMMPGETPLPDTEAGQAGVSEEACEHFAELCRLADKYDIKLIVGLLTGHMSFRFYWPQAFEGRNFLTDPTLIKWEIRFVRYFVGRFRSEPSIAAWDLGNECANYGLGGAKSDQSYVWTHAIASAIRQSDPVHPIVSGFAEYPIEAKEPFNIREQSELLDINTTHPYQIFSATSIDPIDTLRACIDPAVRASMLEDLGKKPCFVEEVGSIGYTNCSEASEAAFLRTMLYSTWAQGCHGVCWWCAFDQGGFDYAPYDWNNYGSDYGLFRADGSAKPVADEMKKFADFLDSFGYSDLPKHTTEAVCVIPRELSNPLKILDTAFILAKQANIDLTFAHAEDKLPDSKLYILPSVYSSKPIFLHRLNELLMKVREGASLYISLGDTLFRRLPELTGLTIASRERGKSDKVCLDGIEYDFGGGFTYNIESVAGSCETLASDEDDRPVFVRNSYGRGSIYFLTFPLEAILADRPGIFRNESCTPYYKFYEKFAAEASGSRACRSAHPCVLTTEHIITESRRIVVAVNYMNEPAKSDLTFADGWQIEKIHRGESDGDRLLIPANDAAVLEIIKV